MMTELHITEKILDSCADGELTPEVVLRRILRHLQSKCEVCYEEMERWRVRRWRTPSVGVLLRAVIDERVPAIGEEEEANKDLLTLLPLEYSERERKIRRALSRFRSPLLARSLVQEAIGELGRDLEEAKNLLVLARTILNEGPESAFSREVRAHLLAVSAMTKKVQGKLGEAEELFKQSRRISLRQDVVDLVLAGELDEMEGSFLKDRRRLEKAEVLLERGLTRYRILGDTTRQARILLVLAAVRFYRGQYEQAICDARRVVELAPGHRAYGVMATHAVGLYLVESGRPKDAARQLKQNEMRYKEAEGVWRLYDLHFHWLAGKISYGLQRYGQAETHLTKARAGFAQRGTTYDTVLVCLDLALVYDATGRYDDLLELTGTISNELNRVSLHEEAAAAVTLFLKAAAKRAVSEELVRKISHFLQFSRTDPTLKCEISANLTQ